MCYYPGIYTCSIFYIVLDRAANSETPCDKYRNVTPLEPLRSNYMTGKFGLLYGVLYGGILPLLPEILEPVLTVDHDCIFGDDLMGASTWNEARCTRTIDEFAPGLREYHAARVSCCK